MPKPPQLDIRIFWNPTPPISEYGLKPFDCYYVYITYWDGKHKQRIAIPMLPETPFENILVEIAPRIKKAIERLQNKLNK